MVVPIKPLGECYSSTLVEHYKEALERGKSRNKAKLYAIKSFVSESKKWDDENEFLKKIAYHSERYKTERKLLAV